jgi:signal transduction histidine kinase
MFRKILVRLTATNSIVVFILFLLFGANIYGYVAYSLFDQVDDNMRSKAGLFQIRNGRPALTTNKLALFDPRIIILLRSQDGLIINLYSHFVDDPDALSKLAEQAVQEKIIDRRQGLHTYRIYAAPYRHGENTLNRPGLPAISVSEVIAVSIVDSEVALLRRLVLILVIGLVAGTMIIILTGYFLARRALAPVRSAWEKQQQFVADASHELRTPLAVIKSNAELTLRHPNHTVEEEGIRITNVIREASRMNRLVSSLLTLAQADNGQNGLNRSTVNLSNVIENVSEQFEPIAETKGIGIELELSDGIIINADKERLHQLLVILLDNAIKYTSSGRIIVGCQQQSGNIVLKVFDTGCGIPPDDLPHVFDRFYRGDKARNRDSGGTGLGLAIAKWIVEAHGGKIQAESKVGVGTEFTVTLPQ